MWTEIFKTVESVEDVYAEAASGMMINIPTTFLMIIYGAVEYPNNAGNNLRVIIREHGLLMRHDHVSPANVPLWFLIRP